MERQTHINTRLTTVLVLYVCYKKICFNCLYMYEPLNTKHASENNGHLLHVFCIVCSWLLNLGLVLFSFIVPSMRISMPVVVWIFTSLVKTGRIIYLPRVAKCTWTERNE